MNISHIYWFCYFSTEEPSVRYRALYPLAELSQNHEITYSIVYPGYSIKSILYFLYVWFGVLLFRKKDSVIVFQKIYTNHIYSLALRILLFFRRKRTLYDIDDAEYLRYNEQVIHYFMRNCEACAVGSRELYIHARLYNSNVFLLTSPVIAHNQLKTAINEHFTIGWIGYYDAHKPNLHELVFPAVANADIDIRLIILGVTKAEDREEVISYFAGKSHVTLEMPDEINWHNEETVYEHISRFDIGVAPLLNNEFNRAKSAFKMKQCLSVGVPVLASNIGENSWFLNHSNNGFFCNTPAEYLQMIHHIKALCEEEYLALCTAAKESASDFSMGNYGNVLLDYYKK
ncbi:MAG: glycosyltransferase [Bacteroidota bacterium]